MQHKFLIAALALVAVAINSVSAECHTEGTDCNDTDKPCCGDLICTPLGGKGGFCLHKSPVKKLFRAAPPACRGEGVDCHDSDKKCCDTLTCKALPSGVGSYCFAGKTSEPIKREAPACRPESAPCDNDEKRCCKTCVELEGNNGSYCLNQRPDGRGRSLDKCRPEGAPCGEKNACCGSLKCKTLSNAPNDSYCLY